VAPASQAQSAMLRSDSCSDECRTSCSADAHGVLHDRPIQVALFIEGNRFRLGIPLIVHRPRPQPILSRTGVPLQVPPNPRLLQVRLPQPRGRPTLPLVQAPPAPGDLPAARPRSPAEEISSSGQRRPPRHLEGALHASASSSVFRLPSCIYGPVRAISPTG